MLTSEVPLMFLTDTRDVLEKRVKRLRKLKQNVQSPSSGSKDGSSGFQSCSGKFTLREDQQYLHEINLSYSELMWDESSFFMDWNREIDQDVHDIYGRNGRDDDISEQGSESQLLMVNEFLDGEGNQITFHKENKQKVMKEESKVQQQDEMKLDFFGSSDVDHLICDFQDVDVQQAVEFYRQIMKSKHGSVVMSEILEQQYKNSSNISLHRLSSHITQSHEPQHPVITLSFPHQPLKLSKRLQTQPVLSNYLSIFGPHKKHQNNFQTIKQHHSRASSQSIKKKHMHELIYFNEGLNKAIMQNEEQDFDQSQMFKKKQNRTARIRQKAEKLLEKIRADSLAGQITVK